MRRNVRLDLGLQGRGEHPPGRSPSRAISSRPAASSSRTSPSSPSSLAYDSSTGWQLIHQHYPAGSAQPIPVENYPTTSDRLRRNVITAQKAAGAAIEDLTGRRIQGWGDDEDGAGDPYWSAHLHQADPEINP